MSGVLSEYQVLLLRGSVYGVFCELKTVRPNKVTQVMGGLGEEVSLLQVDRRLRLIQ